jgi:putative ABC transport system ATP-binding protein
MNMSENSSKPAVEAVDLTKIYGSGATEIVAMREVSLRLEPGEVIALLGPSGSGKSTLLTALGLINPPTAGRVAIGGVLVLEGDCALTDLAAFRRRHIGFVFQKANLIPFLNAVQNVQIAMEINDIPPRPARRRAMELLGYLGVMDCANRLPDTLSGGQQQRVAVARALANEPGLILADEPTAALDGARGLQIMELFSKVAHEGGAGVIVVTHDHRALNVFDRVLQMEDGRVWPAEKMSFPSEYSGRTMTHASSYSFSNVRVFDHPAAGPCCAVKL